MSNQPPDGPPEPRKPAGPGRTSAILRLLWLLVAVVAIALLLNGAWNAGATPDAASMTQLGTMLLVLLFAGAALMGRGLRVTDIIRGLVGWALVGLVAVSLYAFRSELVTVGGRILAAFVPGVPIAGRLVGESDAESVVVIRDRGGQFAVRAHVEDVPLTMLVDTGASFVTLTLANAAGIGIDIRDLNFNIPIRTANGLIRAAPITIKRLVVGTIERNDVAALVAPADSLHESLLGMSFLETLAGYAISGDRLVLND